MPYSSATRLPWIINVLRDAELAFSIQLDLGLSFLIQLDLAIALIFCDVGLTHFIQWDPLCNSV